jgi:hypothetical protein
MIDVFGIVALFSERVWSLSVVVGEVSIIGK